MGASLSTNHSPSSKTCNIPQQSSSAIRSEDSCTIVAMPGTPSFVPPLAPAVSQAEVAACEGDYFIDEVKQTLLQACSNLIFIDEVSTLWKTTHSKPSGTSLRVLNRRLHTGRLAPNPLKSNTEDPVKVQLAAKTRTGKTAMNRPLEDFEDMYYAILAKIKDIHHHISVRMENGFAHLDTAISAADDAPTIATVLSTLIEHWEILNDPGLVEPLDEAVRRSRVKNLHLELLYRKQDGTLDAETADEYMLQLYLPADYESIPGLAWIGGWAPSMISAWLEEKYRVLLKAEKAEAQRAEEEANLKRKREEEELKEKKKLRAEIIDKLRRDRLNVQWEMKVERVSMYREYLANTVGATTGGGGTFDPMRNSAWRPV